MSACGWRNYTADGMLKGPTPSDTGWHNYTPAGVLKASGSGGTVTSVGLDVQPASLFDVSGSPVTGASTITVTMDVQDANKVIAGPASGSPAVPGARYLVSDDIPNLDAAKITTGTLPVERGGTEQSSLTDKALLLGAGTAPIAFLSPGTAGNVARSTGSAWESAVETHLDNLAPNSSFDVWENGVGVSVDNWLISGAGATCERESTIIKHGLYSAKLTRSGADCYIYAEMATAMGTPYHRSRTYTLGAWVYATVAGRARLAIYDSVPASTTYSSYHSGGSSWEFLTVTVTMNASAGNVEARLVVDTGNTAAYFDAVMFVEGSYISGSIFQPTRLSVNKMPMRCTLWHDEATVTNGNAIAYFQNTSQVYNCLPQQNTPAINDTFTHSFWLAAGTYTFYMLTCTASTRGICTWYLDGVSIGTVDLYTAGNVFNVIKTLTMTVRGDGYHHLQGVAASKHASSSNYSLEFNKYWFAPATD